MNKETKKNLKRFLPLSLCCIIPILLILIAPAIGFYSPKTALGISFIAPFICPLIMGGLFFFLFRDNKSCCNKSTDAIEK
ncbi:hypothetical protein [Faecalimicrobium dakarense]|uniref:hypothetical protein n=1 Tax=Faecalimicrobium dakarense TaxID=1301100 RepID=UPI0004B50C74|nr:hypothetical protein [[Clostridium] dakarense]